MIKAFILTRIKTLPIFFLSLFLTMYLLPKIFSVIFYNENYTGYMHYINDPTILLKFLFATIVFKLCAISLGSFLVNRKFSSGEKILIIITLPLVNFFSLSASSALKGTDIVKFSEGISCIDLGLFFIIYYILIYMVLQLDYKTNSLDKEPLLIIIFSKIKKIHIDFKNYFWLKKAL
ncbi:hypothetical protein C7G98_05290 [Acinetobacter baumannii]|uniref:hypothetical protein n=1 Tax=Acinetobacter baumannii TaxID=470 RepID=UPI000D0B44CF|nr:hypothetical protein [Acinetobacter baumannii]MDH2580734.1 hypothetical protein [Acinetobacter baumannii]PSE11649.1 hypothetical protein C7G98_05290 [Acinetobacter baumannii]